MTAFDPKRKFTGCSAARKPTLVVEQATTKQVVDMGLLTKPPSRPAIDVVADFGYRSA
jgi:hypothetical protein